MALNARVLVHRIQRGAAVACSRLNVSSYLISGAACAATHDTRAFSVRSYFWVVIVRLKLGCSFLKVVVVDSVVDAVA